MTTTFNQKVQFLPDDDGFSRQRPAPGRRQHLPATIGPLAQEQSDPFAAGGRSAADQSRGQDTRVVPDQYVAGAKQLGELRKRVMTQTFP